MIVVGGTYRELVANPGRQAIRGSGFRAAAALREVTDIHLVSAIDSQQRSVADLTAGGLGLSVDWLERSEPIVFNYFTPVSTPALTGRLASIEGDVDVDASTVLVFGMIELPLEGMRISARSLVIDPQQPRDLRRLNLNQLKCDRLALVLNSREARTLGRSDSVGEAARNLLSEYGCEVVVSKLAARGALVTTRDDDVRIGPFPTRSVWPLGSGDVFAAAFSFFWGERGDGPTDAARNASRAVAEWCGNPRDDHTIKLDLPPTEELHPRREACVYLAGPFFNLGERWLVELAHGVIRGLGCDVFSPMHAIGPGGPEVAEADLAGLDLATAVFALLDGSDAGTLFETGYATKCELPVIGYAESADSEGSKMLEGTGAELHADLSTALYRSAWAAMGLSIGEP